MNQVDNIRADEPSSVDHQLVGRAQRGDATAFETLVGRHKDRVYGLAVRMLSSREDAAEVAQDTFLAASRHLHQFRGDAQFGSWVHRIASNEALMRLRRRRVEPKPETPAEDVDDVTVGRHAFLEDALRWSGRDAEEAMLDAELRQAIEEAASSLADEYRAVFVLRDLEGVSYQEIASLTHSTVGAIKSRLHRARLTLRAAIERFYAVRVG